ncbi:hypothetical protein ABK040_009137 [Willaertia magna]
MNNRTQIEQQYGISFHVPDRYQDLNVIGKGSYGIVCSAYDTITNSRVAIKKVIRCFDHLIFAVRLLREVKLLGFLKHSNIIHLRHVQLPFPDKDNYTEIYMYTDLMDTDLKTIIQSPQDLTNDHIQFFMYQILKAVNYIHSANVIHRDLKPSNILINSDCNIKICDLGLARGFDEPNNNNNMINGKNNNNNMFKKKPMNNNVKLTEYVVTRWYRAPELLLHSNTYGKEVDIWSVGCIFAELLGREPIFRGTSHYDQLIKIFDVIGTPTHKTDFDGIELSDASYQVLRDIKVKPKTPFSNIYRNATPEALDLLEKLLTFSPKRRISAYEALEHPYFEDIHEFNEGDFAPEVFDYSFENEADSISQIRHMIYDEIVEKYDHSSDNEDNMTLYQLQTAMKPPVSTAVNNNQQPQQQIHQQQQTQMQQQQNGEESSSSENSEFEDEEHSRMNQNVFEEAETLSEENMSDYMDEEEEEMH